MLSFFDSWFPFIYLYGVGGIFFFSGMYLIRKCGAIDLTLKRHRKWYRIMFFGYFYFVAMHFILIIVALYC